MMNYGSGHTMAAALKKLSLMNVGLSIEGVRVPILPAAVLRFGSSENMLLFDNNCSMTRMLPRDVNLVQE